jgi:hypothetical protein
MTSATARTPLFETQTNRPYVQAVPENPIAAADHELGMTSIDMYPHLYPLPEGEEL